MELLVARGDPALVTGTGQEAQGVQRHLELGGGTDEQAVDGLVGAQPGEADLEESAALQNECKSKLRPFPYQNLTEVP